MSTVTIEIAGDVAEDKLDSWLDVSDTCTPPVYPVWKTDQNVMHETNRISLVFKHLQC